MGLPNRGSRCLLSIVLLVVFPPTWAGQEAAESSEPALSVFQECVLRLSESASNVLTVGQLRSHCSERVRTQDPDSEGRTRTPLQRRIELEQFSLNNPFSLLPHRPNYLLPVTYTQYPDKEYLNQGEGRLQNIEVQFQLSLKVVLLDGLYRDAGSLSFAYTTRSFWQAYNIDLSSPFRETNHEPELILALGSRYEFGGFRNVGNAISLNHQSNGLSDDDSRSWNRVIFQTIWERGRYAIALRPWYRIPSPEERYPGDPLGDDNPDIQDYMGHFDLNLAYAGSVNQYTLMVRNNLSRDNKGALQLGWSFPLNERVRGRLHYFEGYGESLIDYDSYSRSLGIGFELSGWL